jgi:hypothetical protein
MEAIAPEKGSGVNEVPNRKSGSVPETRIRGRYTYAIRKKVEKWNKYVADGIVGGQDAYIVALSGAKVPLADLELGDHPRIVEMVLDRAAAPQTPENDPSICAVVFSPNHLKNLPQARGRTRGDDLIIVHNPHARRSVGLGSIPAGREYWRDGGEIRSKDWRPPKRRKPRWLEGHCFAVTRDVPMRRSPSGRASVRTLRMGQIVVYLRRRGKRAKVTAMPMAGEEWLTGWVSKKYLRESS